MFKFRLDNKGSAAVLLCFVITGLLGFTALVVDVGSAYSERTKLSNALDSAALAASLEIHNGEEKVKMVALEYLKKNNVDPEEVQIITSSNSIEIKGLRNVEHFFAPIIGIDDSNVTADTKAIIGPVGAVRGGVRPFAVEIFDYVYGDQIILKADAGSGYKGNYKAIALGGTGANNFKENALFGFTKTLSVGDWIPTETGNMAGATNDIKNYINSEVSSFDDFERDTIRLWTIPLVNTMEVNGRGEIQVVGFGQFYVEDVHNKGGKVEITGRFIRYVTNGIIDMDAPDTGTYAVKLSK